MRYDVSQWFVMQFVFRTLEIVMNWGFASCLSSHHAPNKHERHNPEVDPTSAQEAALKKAARMQARKSKAQNSRKEGSTGAGEGGAGIGTKKEDPREAVFNPALRLGGIKEIEMSESGRDLV